VASLLPQQHRLLRVNILGCWETPSQCSVVGDGHPSLMGHNSLLLRSVSCSEATLPDRAVGRDTLTSKVLNRRQARWAQELAGYDFVINSIPGTPWLWWLAGLYPRYLLGRERYRWRNRVQTLPPDHPLGEGYRLPRTKAGVVCIRQLKASNQALSGSHVIRSLELSSDFPQPRPGRTKSRLRIWSRGGGPINHNLASGTALRPNLSSSCLIGGASLGGLPRHQDMVTSSSTTSGSTTRRVRSKLALAARQYPEATSSSAPSPPLTILLLAAWTPEHFGTHINCSRIEKSQLEPSGLARDHPILIHILFFRLDPPLRVIGRAHDDGGQ
jgi:hypothetical protein